MVRTARPKTCRQTAQLWGAQTTGVSLAPVKILVMGMWLNADGALQVDGGLGSGNRQAPVQTSVLAHGCVAWLSSQASCWATSQVGGSVEMSQ